MGEREREGERERLLVISIIIGTVKEYHTHSGGREEWGVGV